MFVAIPLFLIFSGLVVGFPSMEDILPDFTVEETIGLTTNEIQELTQLTVFAFIPTITILFLGAYFFFKGDRLVHLDKVEHLKAEFGEAGFKKIDQICREESR